MHAWVAMTEVARDDLFCKVGVRRAFSRSCSMTCSIEVGATRELDQSMDIFWPTRKRCNGDNLHVENSVLWFGAW